jgi:2-oxo-4-hydroxy-4-carboxy--5-ureidoimidazoline (OHCU) decarboxylase
MPITPSSNGRQTPLLELSGCQQTKMEQGCYSTMLKTLQNYNTALLEAMKALPNNQPLHTIQVHPTMADLAAAQQAID